MTNPIRNYKFFLLFSLLISSFVFSATTNLPVISVEGKTCKNNERVNLHVRLEASKYTPPYCFSEVAMPDGTTRYPHAFYVRGLTVSNFQMNFNLDIDIQVRLKEKVLSYYPKGIDFEGSKVPAIDYFNSCRFRLNEVTLYNAGTSLIIRDSFYNRLESIYRVDEGTTQTADYSLNRAGNRLKFEVYIKKSE
jgi:hypothetical protein